MRNYKNKIIKILSFILITLIIITFGIYFIPKITQNDIFFDIRTGSDILKYGIDFKDHFSFIPNLTYLYHHYLFDLIVYFIYKLFNMMGIFILTLSMYILLGITIFRVNYTRSKNGLFSLLISLLTMWFMKDYYSDRVQIISYVLFFLEVYNLEKLYTKFNFKNAIFLILLSILIANFHMPLWILTLILTLPYIFEYIMYLVIKKFPKIKNIISNKIIIEDIDNNKQFFITILVLIFTGLLTPLKIYPYTFFTKTLGNTSYNFIQELSLFSLFNIPCLIILAILFIVLIILNNKIKLRDLGLVAGIFVFGLMASRNFAYVYLLIPTILFKVLSENYNLQNIKINFIWKHLNQTIIYISLIILLIITLNYQYHNFKYFDYGMTDNYPNKIADYLIKNTDYKNIKLYTRFEYGSYLAFRNIPIFVDSRAEVFIKNLNGGYDIISDYLKTFSYYNYKETLEKYNFDYLIVYAKSDLDIWLSLDERYEKVLDENDEMGYILYKLKNV